VPISKRAKWMRGWFIALIVQRFAGGGLCCARQASPVLVFFGKPAAKRLLMQILQGRKPIDTIMMFKTIDVRREA